MKYSQNPISHFMAILPVLSLLLLVNPGNIKANSSADDMITCISHLNVSLGTNCTFEVLPSNILEGAGIVDADYTIEIEDAHGHVVPNNTFTIDHLDKCFDVHVTEIATGNMCWGEMCVEDKLAPAITCVDEVIGGCSDLDLLIRPVVVEACGDHVLDSVVVIEHFDCPDVYSSVVTTTYTATDERGNVSSPCEKVVSIERIDTDAIVCPVDEFEVSCTLDYLKDEEGHPHPSISGCPVINGVEICDNISNLYCELDISYVDVELGVLDCTFKILRTWTMVTNDCDDPVLECEQLLKISDLSAPTIVCPADLTVFADVCNAVVQIPPVTTMEDGCSGNVGITVNTFHPNGSLLNSNGGEALLNDGDNIIRYVVTDVCGNEEECMTTITVVDGRPPVALCDLNATVALTSDDVTNIYAEVFDNGSYDDCSAVTFTAARMDSDCNEDDVDFDQYVGFCCADIGTEVMVILKVTDASMNENICMIAVDVQNKLGVTVSCPGDMTIDCTDDFDINDLIGSFGDIEVFDQCGITGDITRESDISALTSCNTGVIERVFTYTKAGVDYTCNQTITLNGDVSFTDADIDWPDDFDVEIDMCDPLEITPAELEPPHDYPVLMGDGCQKPTFEYEDEIFNFAGSGACQKILRTWTAINQCDGTAMNFTHQQTLKVFKTNDPSIDPDPITGELCPAVVACSDDPDNCGPGMATLIQTGSDDCTDMPELNWSYEITDATTGDVVASGNTNDASGEYEIGVYLILWTVEDGCGNKVSCTQDFEMSACKLPTAVCLDELSIALSPMDLIDASTGEEGQDQVVDAEMAFLDAFKLDNSSFAPCNGELVFSFSSNVQDTLRTFDCDDLTNVDPVTGNGFGFVTLDLWVTIKGTDLQSVCENVIVEIQDNNNVDFCDPLNLTGNNISGNIQTESNRNVENVFVELLGSEMNPYETNAKGDYAFDQVEMGRNYDVKPNKNDAPLNGVSTLDLVKIQKHVLGIEKLDSPYKLIAADINSDGTVSSIDLIELRKLILGLYDEFPDNTSWRFVDQTFEFTSPENPFASAFSESYYINNFDSDMNVNFVAVKTGDVNNTSKVNQNESIVENRSNENINLVRSKIAHLENGMTSIAYTLDRSISVEGLQFEFDVASSFELESIESALASFQKANYSIDGNSVTISWADFKGTEQTLDVNQEIFKIIGKLSANYNLDDAFLNLSSNKIENEIYANGQVVGVELIEEEVRLESGSIAAEGFELFQNTPNPWTDETEISFYLPADDYAELRFYNSRGESLLTHKEYFSAGKHKMKVNSENLNADGVLIYKLIYRNQVQSQKMILIK